MPDDGASYCHLTCLRAASCPNYSCDYSCSSNALNNCSAARSSNWLHGYCATPWRPLKFQAGVGPGSGAAFATGQCFAN